MLTREQAGGRLVLQVRHGDTEFVTWDSLVPDAPAEPVTPAREPAAPADVQTVEELAMVGAHLEQYRHATRSPEPYWREALRRDPGHVASSVGLPGRAYQRGDLAEAESLLRAAVARLTGLNANPADTTALYALGLVLERRCRVDEAYDVYAAGSEDWPTAPNNHSPRARFSDSVLSDGVRLHAELAVHALERDAAAAAASVAS